MLYQKSFKSDSIKLSIRLQIRFEKRAQLRGHQSGGGPFVKLH